MFKGLRRKNRADNEISTFVITCWYTQTHGFIPLSRLCRWENNRFLALAGPLSNILKGERALLYFLMK